MHDINKNHQDYINKTVSPVEVVEYALRTAQTQQADSVFIKLTTEKAIKAAKAAHDRFKKGADKGVLDGITIVWKDIFDQEGEITTLGSLTRNSVAKATKSAHAVQLLESAGMCSLGRTNLSEFAFSGLGINPHFGTPSSVLRPKESNLPGGSSSGSAVAVGLGLAQIGMGTDTSGSIRIPSALNGLFGFRPTLSRYDKKGVFPLSPSLDTVGVIARHIDDIILIDKVLAQNHNDPVLKESNTIFDISELLDISWSDEIFIAYTKTLHIFENQGYNIRKPQLSTISKVKELLIEYGTLVSVEAKMLYADLLQTQDANLIDPMIRDRLEKSNALTKAQHGSYLDSRLDLINLTKLEVGSSLIAHPTVPSIHHKKAKYLSDKKAFNQLNANMLSATMVGSFLDLPGIAMPIKDNSNEIVGSILLSAAQEQDEALLHHSKILANALIKT